MFRPNFSLQNCIRTVLLFAPCTSFASPENLSSYQSFTGLGFTPNAQVIDIKSIPHSGKVLFGTTVSIINVDTDEEVEYRIVGDDEADIKNNRISVSSPIARALIGKSEGDTVVVNIPSGTVEYEIDEVKHV